MPTDIFCRTRVPQRFLDTQLTQVAASVSICPGAGVQHTVDVKDSPTYGIRTRYARITYTGRLTGSFDMTMLPASAQWLNVENSTDSSLLGCLGWGRQASVAAQENVIRVLSQFEHVLMMKTSGLPKLYLWLSQEDFDVLSDMVAEPFLSTWISFVGDITPDPYDGTFKL